jgi:dTDP-4-dehydrorhamnose 3,5-epimerase
VPADEATAGAVIPLLLWHCCALSTTRSPKQDIPTVSSDGTRLGPLIDGVLRRRAVTQIDERGTLCEILDGRWGIHPAPIVSVYQFTIRPGKIKGWHVHRLHDDRIFISRGEIKVVLFDARPESPTYELLNEIPRTDLERDLMVIPAGVFHAHQNVGSEDALLVSMPTRAYDHGDPDVWRLPIDTDEIPYQFESRRGW